MALRSLHVGTRERTVALLVALAMSAACGGSPSTAGHSPTPRATSSPTATSTTIPTPTPQPVTTPYGVLVTRPGAAGQTTYTVTIVRTDGSVAASHMANVPPPVSCANAAAALVPLPVSTSNSGVYFLDSGSAVTFMSPDGAVHTVTSVPAGSATRRSMFAVSPDDQRIAVIVDDFTSSGASTRLYVEDLNGGGNHIELFSESGAYTLWPIGWHTPQNLVVAKVPSCTQGGGPFCCGPVEYHVVDPATANRRFVIGGSTCPIAGAPSIAGVVCENPPTATALSWTDATIRTYPIQGPIGAYLSPNGNNVAFVDNVGTTFTGGGSAMAGVFTCEWIDDSHVLAGGDTQQQARIGDLSTHNVTAVAAQGECAGRLPGGL